MPDEPAAHYVERERRHLALADRHIAETGERIARQERLVTRLTEGGHDTAVAEDLLRIMRDILRGMEDHRRMILRALAGDAWPGA